MLDLQGKSHMAVGGAFAVVTGVALHLPLADQALMIPFGMVGSLLPDMDTRASYLGKAWYKFLSIFGSWTGKAWRWLHGGHRGRTHSLLAVGITFLMAYGIQELGHHYHFWGHPSTPVVPLAIAVGVFSHLFADGLTTVGVPAFWPLLKWKARLPSWISFPTGTKQEAWTLITVWSLTITYVAYVVTAPWWRNGGWLAQAPLWVESAILGAVLLVSGIVLYRIVKPKCWKSRRDKRFTDSPDEYRPGRRSRPRRTPVRHAPAKTAPRTRSRSRS